MRLPISHLFTAERDAASETPYSTVVLISNTLQHRKCELRQSLRQIVFEHCHNEIYIKKH